ncbi:hypothetical protein ACLOJK_006113 [Asimina triloba]
MASQKDVGILAMDIYFPPTCVRQVDGMPLDFGSASAFAAAEIVLSALFSAPFLLSRTPAMC